MIVYLKDVEKSQYSGEISIKNVQFCGFEILLVDFMVVDDYVRISEEYIMFFGRQLVFFRFNFIFKRVELFCMRLFFFRNYIGILQLIAILWYRIFRYKWFLFLDRFIIGWFEDIFEFRVVVLLQCFFDFWVGYVGQCGLIFKFQNFKYVFWRD